MSKEVDYNNRSNSEVVDGQAREEAIVEVKMGEISNTGEVADVLC
jgi:hypothetical protein